MQCAVPTCPNASSSNCFTNDRVSLHRFPKDEKLRRAWAGALDLKDSEVTGKNLLCTNHFHGESYYRKAGSKIVLKTGAVPVLPVCRVCLATDVKLFNMYENMNIHYGQLIGVNILDRRLPKKICWECIYKFDLYRQFKEKAIKSHSLLLSIADSDEFISLKSVQSIDRNVHGLESNLSQIATSLIDITDENDDNKNEYPIQIQFNNPSDNRSDIDVYNAADAGDDKDSIDIQFNINSDNISDKDIGTDQEIDDKSSLSTIKLKIEESANKIEDVKKQKMNVSNVHNDTNTGVEKGSIDIAFNNHSDNKSDIDIIHDVETDDEKDSIDNLFNIDSDNISDVDIDIDTDTDIDDKKPLSSIKVQINKPEKKIKEVKKKEMLKKESDKGEKVVDKSQNVIQPRARNSELDLNMFTIRLLSHEEQIKEIASRKHSEAYKKAPFKCTLCFRGFPTQHRLGVHNVRHTEKSGTHECAICKTRLKSARALKGHMNGLHKEQFSCKKCSFVTKARDIAYAHFNWHSGAKYRCGHCGSEFDKYTTYLGHVRLTHGSDFVCSLCGYTFLSQRGVEQHLKKKHKISAINVPLEGPYCSVCDVKFLNDEAHLRHLKVSSKHKSERDRMLILNASHAQGNKTKVIDQPVKCQECGVILRNTHVYGQHLRFVHPGKHRTPDPKKKSRYVCDLCGRVFQFLTLLKDHEAFHAGVTTHICDVCKSGFVSRFRLQRHMVIHNKPRFTCVECGKGFHNEYKLGQHALIHKGLKPHRCESCDKSFRLKEQLKAHITHVHHKKPRPVKRTKRKIIFLKYNSEEESSD